MELYERPANLFVASFLGSANILDGKARRRSTVRGRRSGWSSGRSTPSRCRPAQHARRRRCAARSRIASSWAPRCATACAIGDSEILVDAPFQSGSELRAVGDTVGVALPPERMLYLPA